MQNQVASGFFSALLNKKEGLFIGLLFGVIVSGASVTYLSWLNEQSLQQRIENHETTIAEYQSRISSMQSNHDLSLKERDNIHNLRKEVLEYELEKLRSDNQLLTSTNNALIIKLADLNGAVKAHQTSAIAEKELVERGKSIRMHIAQTEKTLREAHSLAASHKQSCEEYKQRKNIHWASRTDCDNYRLAQLSMDSAERRLINYNNELIAITQKLSVR